MNHTTRAVYRAEETGEFFVAVPGGLIEDLDYVDEGGRVWTQSYVDAHFGAMTYLGTFTDAQIVARVYEEARA